MGAEGTDFVGNEIRGNKIVLRVLKHHPPRVDDHYREIEVPASVFNNEISGTHPSIEALNSGEPLPFEIHVMRWRDGPGPWQYDIVFGKRPEPGQWAHEDLVEPEGDPE